MSDQVLESVTDATLDDNEELQGGAVFLFRWLAETWGEAGKGVVQQVIVALGAVGPCVRCRSLHD